MCTNKFKIRLLKVQILKVIELLLFKKVMGAEYFCPLSFKIGLTAVGTLKIPKICSVWRLDLSP